MTLHAWHSPVHELTQQYPSTHLPLKQSVGEAHVCPFSLLQLPPPSQETFAPEHIIVALVSSPPNATGEHVPSLPFTLQAWHVAVQVLLQQ